MIVKKLISKFLVLNQMETICSSASQVDLELINDFQYLKACTQLAVKQFSPDYIEKMQKKIAGCCASSTDCSDHSLKKHIKSFLNEFHFLRGVIIDQNKKLELRHIRQSY